MLLFPAIDLVGGKAVRLFKGDYAQMTVYNDDPTAVARDFAAAGATAAHLVDLEGARDGDTPNFETVCAIKEASGLFCEIGGGIRTMDVVDRYLNAGIDCVILGTAAVTDPAFVQAAVEKHGERIAVGIDVKDGFVAIKGWTEQSAYTLQEFAARMEAAGVSTIICTDVSKDGAMQGTNVAMYEELARTTHVNITASGGVSTLADVKRLAAMGLYGAIIGKAYYTGAIDLREALQACAEAPAISADISADDLRFDGRGLIPAIVQDAETGRVLTLAYMNRESLQITMERGLACFWSRSRRELWLKGATSGNYQHVLSITADCDADALVVKVRPEGPACHLGTTSCFERPVWRGAERE